MVWYYSLEEVFFTWERMGVFEIILPFLLIFAIVFGILSSTKFTGENRAVHVLIAIVIALMALRWRGFVSSFLTTIFPKLGVGLAVILTIIILVGMFIAKDETRYWGWGLAAIAGVIAIVVVYQSFRDMGLISYGGYSSDMVGLIILGVLLVGVIIAVAVSGREGKSSRTPEATFITGWGGRK